MARRTYFYVQGNKVTAKGEQYTPSGFFTCKETTASFLGIEALAQVPSNAVVERAAYNKTTAEAGGGDAKTVAVAKSFVLSGVGGKGGSKTVTIKTYDKIATSQAQNKDNAYHVISFRFPSWCSALDISDALGEIIPEEKFAAPGQDSQSKIERFFKTKGGRKYPIIKGIAAEARGQDSTPTAATAGVEVPETQAEADSLAEKKEGQT